MGRRTGGTPSGGGWWLKAGCVLGAGRRYPQVKKTRKAVAPGHARRNPSGPCHRDLAGHRSAPPAWRHRPVDNELLLSVAFTVAAGPNAWGVIMSAPPDGRAANNRCVSFRRNQRGLSLSANCRESGARPHRSSRGAAALRVDFASSSALTLSWFWVEGVLSGRRCSFTDKTELFHQRNSRVGQSQ